jgi:DNA-binding NtrC family response regulator
VTDATIIKGPLSGTGTPQATSRRLDILVVDDEVNVGNLLRDALVRHGHRVVTFTDGQRAVQEAARRSFDVVFLDIRMPGMNGLQTLKALHRLLPKATVIMITGYAESELVDESLESGAFVCLSKPLSIFEVVEMVQSFGGEQRAATR